VCEGYAQKHFSWRKPAFCLAICDGRNFRIDAPEKPYAITKEKKVFGAETARDQCGAQIGASTRERPPGHARSFESGRAQAKLQNCGHTRLANSPQELRPAFGLLCQKAAG
jgi:hypothetical protein